jgi:hypothetical protein
MKHNGWTRTLILLASTCLFPLTAMAIEGDRSIEIPNLGEGIDAYVDLSSAEGRMKAVPYVKLSGPRVETLPIASGREGAGISTKTPLPDGWRIIQSVQESKEISFSRGSRLLREARDALKNRKRQNGGTEKTAEMAKEASNNIRQ